MSNWRHTPHRPQQRQTRQDPISFSEISIYLCILLPPSLPFHSSFSPVSSSFFYLPFYHLPSFFTFQLSFFLFLSNKYFLHVQLHIELTHGTPHSRNIRILASSLQSHSLIHAYTHIQHSVRLIWLHPQSNVTLINDYQFISIQYQCITIRQILNSDHYFIYYNN